MWAISITSPGFPEDKTINFLNSQDQQIVDLDELIDDFIKHAQNDDFKVELADLLDSLARKIRSRL